MTVTFRRAVRVFGGLSIAASAEPPAKLSRSGAGVPLLKHLADSRQEEERRRREEEMRRQQEEMMRRQQEGFKGAFPDAVYVFPCA